MALSARRFARPSGPRRQFICSLTPPRPLSTPKKKAVRIQPKISLALNACAASSTVQLQLGIKSISEFFLDRSIHYTQNNGVFGDRLELRNRISSRSQVPWQRLLAPSHIQAPWLLHRCRLHHCQTPSGTRTKSFAFVGFATITPLIHTLFLCTVLRIWFLFVIWIKLQILKILKHRSVRGLSVVAFELEVIGYTISLAYCLHKGLPFSAFGEYAFLLIQGTLSFLFLLVFALN